MWILESEVGLEFYHPSYRIEASNPLISDDIRQVVAIWAASWAAMTSHPTSEFRETMLQTVPR
jgi:hypothetical protein